MQTTAMILAASAFLVPSALARVDSSMFDENCVYHQCLEIEVRGADNTKVNGRYIITEENIWDPCGQRGYNGYYYDFWDGWENEQGVTITWGWVNSDNKFNGWNIVDGHETLYYDGLNRRSGTKMVWDNWMPRNGPSGGSPPDVRCVSYASKYEDIGLAGMGFNTYAFEKGKLKVTRNLEGIYEYMADQCSQRGQYLCGMEQTCGYRAFEEPNPYPDSPFSGNPFNTKPDTLPMAGVVPGKAYVAVGNPEHVFKGTSLEGKHASYLFLPVGSDQETCQLSLFSPIPTDAKLVYSCCGDHYPGGQQPTTVMYAIALDEPVVMSQVDGTSASVSVVWVTEGFAVEAAAEAGCDLSSLQCEASVKAAIRVTLGDSSSATTFVGGVPVVGKVYYEFTMGVEAEASASAGLNGVEVVASASADMSVTVGAEASGEIGAGITVAGAAQGNVGVTAEATAEATLTLTNITVGVELGTTFGVEGSVSTTSSNRFTESTAEVGGCLGCVGAGFSPSFGVDGCETTIGAEGNLKLLIGGGTFDGSTTINTCELRDALKNTAKKVAKWGKNLCQDVAEGWADVKEAFSAVRKSAAKGSQIVATAVEKTVNKISDGTAKFVNNFGEAFSSGGARVANAFRKVKSEMKGAFNSVGEWAEDASWTIWNGLTDFFGRRLGERLGLRRLGSGSQQHGFSGARLLHAGGEMRWAN